MKFLSSLRVSTRMQLLVGLTLVGLLILCVTALFHIKSTMLEDRKQKTLNLIESAQGGLSYHQKLVADGKLSEEEAKKSAKEVLRAQRYDGANYFFILDDTHHYMLIPTKPENEGKDVSEMKDARGKYLVRDMVALGKAGGGFIEYWFPKAGQPEPEPKLGYIGYFAPWGWSLGTGIYIDDIDTAFKRGAMVLGSISLGLLFLLSLAGWTIGTSVLHQLGGEPKAASDIMERVAAGDLTANIDHAPSGSLLFSLGNMVTALRALIREINNDANSLAKNAAQISRAEQASQAIQRISNTVSDASGRIQALEERANQISSIAGVIKDIAGQTNLLALNAALNAAIEAARAGEAGRGFAVVADEVRKLAERTSTATAEIEQMIAGIQGETVGAVEAMNAALPEVHEGVELAASASESLRAIEDGARRTLERIGEVADATREQSTASTSISQRVEQIANMVEETTVTIRATSVTAQQLEGIANNLKRQVGKFTV